MIITIALGVVLGLFLFCFLAANLGPVFEARERRRKQKVEEHIHRIMTDPEWGKPKPPKPQKSADEDWLSPVIASSVVIFCMFWFFT